uniref:Anamorsin homolog n=1 Tax=Phlebotomus kandelakii TaxID=1109342 RepID=A0A6B2E4Z9_9DIPT
MEFVKPGNHVLYVWISKVQSGLEKAVNEIRHLKDVVVSVENSDRLEDSTYTNSTFDVILSHCSSESTTNEKLKLFLNLVKPQRPVVFMFLKSEPATLETFEFQLKAAGYVNVKKNASHVFVAEKPNYEVGSSVKLSFAVKKPTAAVWKLEDDDEDEEVINEDDLLDESDKQKPDEASLRVCGTTGKRKACKDCSCGLAEELNGQQKNTADAPKSSCGSCYLGDAFRCASCPYLGMPAFKPGEKIQISSDQLMST